MGETRRHKEDFSKVSSKAESGFVERMQKEGFGSYDFRNDEMNIDDAYRLGKSLADFYEGGTVVVGEDHREYSEEVKNGLLEGLWEKGCEIDYIGVSTTDMVAHRVNDTGAEGGVAVTASHMPPEYRGIKPLNYEGRIFDKGELDQVREKYVRETGSEREYREWNTRHLGDAYENYIGDLSDRYHEIFDVDLSNMRVAVDPGNGVGTLTLPRLLSDLGVKSEDLYLVNNVLDSEFSGRGPDPTKSDLNELKQVVKDQNLDLGIALDGDADRAVYVNEKGEKVGGDEALAILASRYLDEDGDEGEGEVACSINTSPVLADLLYRGDKIKAPINYTPVGAVFPAKEALREGSNTVFGGQPNGHFLDPGFTPYDSGTLLGAVMPGILKETGQKMSVIQDRLPSYQVHRGDIAVEDKELAMEKLEENYSRKGDLRSTENAVRIDLGGEEESLDKANSGMTVIFRPSGNEDIIRWTRVVRDSKKQQDIIEDYLQDAMSKER